MNQTFRVMLNSINDVKTFVNAAARCPYDIDVVSGKYKIDGKSLMGIFSLNLDNPIEIVIADGIDTSEFRETLASYILK